MGCGSGTTEQKQSNTAETNLNHEFILENDYKLYTNGKLMTEKKAFDSNKRIFAQNDNVPPLEIIPEQKEFPVENKVIEKPTSSQIIKPNSRQPQYSSIRDESRKSDRKNQTINSLNNTDNKKNKGSQMVIPKKAPIKNKGDNAFRYKMQSHYELGSLIKKYKTTDQLSMAKYNRDIFAYQNVFRQHPEFVISRLNDLLSDDSCKYPIEEIKDAIDELSNGIPVKKLLWNEGLFMVCNDHLKELSKIEEFSEMTVNEMDIYERFNKYGRYNRMCGENIQVGLENPREIILDLMIDDGLTDKVHRNTLINPSFNKGAVCMGEHPTYGIVTVFAYAE